MKIGLLSDTHGFLDPKIFKHFDSCDEIWHAGDIGNMEVANQLKNFRPLLAVFGNIDDKGIQTEFPEHLFFQREQTSILITHIGGTPPRYNPTAKQLISLHKPSVFVCGHSHVLKIQSDLKNNLLFVNPGASGNHGFHKMKTLVRFEIIATQIKNVQVIEIGERGKVRA